MVAVLGGVPEEPGEEVLAIVAGFLAEGSKAPAGVRRAAAGALERAGGEAARKALEGAFGRATENGEKYALACALTRMGSDAAVPWLRELLAELGKIGDPASRGRAGYVRKLLEKRSK